MYVHTRIAATAYKPAGMYTDYDGVYTGSPSGTVDIALNYTKLDIKVGEVVRLTANPVPNSGTFTGAFWFVNGAEAKLYIDEACATEYVRNTHGLRAHVYLKGITQTNGITVGAEKTLSGNNVRVKNIYLRVTDANGNYRLEGLILPEVTLAPGESVTVDITTMPTPALVGTLSFVKTEGAGNLTLTAGNGNKTLTVKVPAGTAAGSYHYSIKVDGAATKTPSGIIINVVKEKEIPVESVSVLPSAVTLAPGGSADLTAIVSPSNATGNKTVTWSVISGSDRISVDKTGKVTVFTDAPEGAEAVIKATAGGKSGTCTVKVAVTAYGIIVLGGTAYKDDTEATEAEPGTLIDIAAEEPAPGKVFDRWEVVGGGVILDNATDLRTFFVMPEEEAVIQAVYEDKDAAQHTHSYGDWEYNETEHWKECECGDKTGQAEHTIKWVVDKEATAAEKGSKHEECEICGYRKAAVEIPTTQGITDPETDGNGMIWLWIVLLIVLTAGIAGVVIFAKRRAQ